MLRPSRLAEFLRTESAGGAVLLAATVVALVLANSPWHTGWADLWSGPAHHWVNDGLMTLFFYVVGLEITRELTDGELRDPRTAALPVVAALGGMVLPALLFTAVVGSTAGGHGWAIPMATDIAFAVGVLGLLGPRVPPSLKLFLLALAIVDDLGAIVVIAVFYADRTEPLALLFAAGMVSALVALRRARVEPLLPYLVLGAGLWLAMDASGIHPTIAGVVLAGCTPRAWRERLEHRLHPVASFVVIPVFALANAGVHVDAGALDPPGAVRLAAGVAIGLVAGKALGVFGATWLAVRSGVGRLPEGATWTQLAGVAAVAGIGFTVSLFVADLAFPDAGLQAAAKLGILGGSVVAALAGGGHLWRVTRAR
ncbi:MAG: nhaA [Acidimicrobiales bacterium]|nr:nhaA [Acidimicrobiales bacterium]